MLNLPKLSKHMNSLAHEKTVKYFVCKEATDGNELFAENMPEQSSHFHNSPVHQEYYLELEIDHSDNLESHPLSYLCFYVSYPVGKKVFEKIKHNIETPNCICGVFVSITKVLKLSNGDFIIQDLGDWLSTGNKDPHKNSMIELRESPLDLTSPENSRQYMTDLFGILFETLKVIFHDERETVRLSNVKTPKMKIKTNEGNKFVKTPYTIITKEKLVKKTEERIDKKLDWTHSWPVRGHWRNVKTFGKSYKGEIVKGKTWVHEHARGNKDAAVTIKPRVVL